MPPRRRARATVSPSPAPQSRGATPARGGGRDSVRTAVQAKYSTSYGSPMTKMPDRRNVGGGGNIVKAAAEVITKVKKDNIAAEERRRINDQARAGREAGSRAATESPPPHPSIELEDPDYSGHEVDGGSGSEYENDDGSQTRRRTTRKSPRKRVRDDEEEEARAEAERKERDARLRRERAAETRKKRKLAEAEAAAKAAAQAKAEQARLAEQESLAEQKRLAELDQLAQLAREEAARAAMPPPPPPPNHLLSTYTTPSKSTAPVDNSSGRPGSARSFNAEGGVYQGAAVRTPSPEPAPQVPSPQPAPPAGPSSPPSVLRQPPRRPVRTPDSRKSLLNGEPIHPASIAVDDEQSDLTASTYTGRLQHLKPVPERMDSEEEDEDQPDSSLVDDERPTGSATEDKQPPAPKVRRSFTPWIRTLLKVIAVSLLLLYLITIRHLLVRQDLFENPVLTLNWYGWKDWTNNVGQFFPSPLLHPRGVLTNDQYDDLKDYLQKRMTTTEAAVESIKSILPKVVSVRKDRSGRVIIGEEFWEALKDRIHHEQTILTLDGKSQISDKNWKAIHQRLKDANLAGPYITADNVERMIQTEGPRAWERWARDNEKKVAEILNLDKIKDSSKSKTSSDETVISRQEFLSKLNGHLAKHKKQIDTEMDSLRKDLHGLVRDFRATAPIPAASGLSKSEITALIKEVVSKEITHRQFSAVTGGLKWGSTKPTLNESLRRLVNHFGPGNGALLDMSATSPTYKPATPPVGSKEWLKKMPRAPQFLPDKMQALTPWSEPGHCWCAGILGARNRTLPADIVVRLAQFVIPQYVVLEHIDPSATTDPLSMPKDIEVWAVFDEHSRKERVLDWMAAQWPGDVNKEGSRELVEKKGMAKIGEFTYEHKPAGEGVYVHKLSDELVERLKAATDQVLVRAVTNYGARDHTCFYRVRLYGEVVELEAERESRNW
ncbi:hypothetical protein VTI74DRAFT_7221 [Chaetomium olivicolor]